LEGGTMSDLTIDEDKEKTVEYCMSFLQRNGFLRQMTTFDKEMVSDSVKMAYSQGALKGAQEMARICENTFKNNLRSKK
jgi:hypothetical protein